MRCDARNQYSYVVAESGEIKRQLLLCLVKLLRFLNQIDHVDKRSTAHEADKDHDREEEVDVGAETID